MFNRGLLTADKLSSIDLPTVGRPLPKANFTAEEVEQILEQPLLYGFKGMRDRVILETLFATGIHRIELLHLDIEDVDFNQQLIRVRKGKGNRPTGQTPAPAPAPSYHNDHTSTVIW